MPLLESCSLNYFVKRFHPTLESRIDVGPGKFAKKNKHRPWINLGHQNFNNFLEGGEGGNYAIHNGFTVLVSNWLNSYTSRTRLNNTQNWKVIQHLLSESQQNREYRLMGFNPSSAIVGSLKIKQYEIISFFHFKKWNDGEMI